MKQDNSFDSQNVGMTMTATAYSSHIYTDRDIRGAPIARESAHAARSKDDCYPA